MVDDGPEGYERFKLQLFLDRLSGYFPRPIKPGDMLIFPTETYLGAVGSGSLPKNAVEPVVDSPMHFPKSLYRRASDGIPEMPPPYRVVVVYPESSQGEHYFSAPAYMVAEGIGPNASFHLQLSTRVDDNTSEIHLGASGFTSASNFGVVSFYARATMYHNGQKVAEQSFNLPSSYISSSNAIPVGLARFDLPQHGSIEIEITFGYTLSTEGSPSATPIPHNSTRRILVR